MRGRYGEVAFLHLFCQEVDCLYSANCCTRRPFEMVNLPLGFNHGVRDVEKESARTRDNATHVGRDVGVLASSLSMYHATVKRPQEVVLHSLSSCAVAAKYAEPAVLPLP